MRTDVGTSVPMNESSSTVLACLFRAALLAVESPGRALDLLTETHTRVTTYTHGTCTLSNSWEARLFFLSNATQRESAQVIVAGA